MIEQLRLKYGILRKRCYGKQVRMEIIPMKQLKPWGSILLATLLCGQFVYVDGQESTKKVVQRYSVRGGKVLSLGAAAFGLGATVAGGYSWLVKHKQPYLMVAGVAMMALGVYGAIKLHQLEKKWNLMQRNQSSKELMDVFIKEWDDQRVPEEAFIRELRDQRVPEEEIKEAEAQYERGWAPNQLREAFVLYKQGESMENLKEAVEQCGKNWRPKQLQEALKLIKQRQLQYQQPQQLQQPTQHVIVPQQQIPNIQQEVPQNGNFIDQHVIPNEDLELQRVLLESVQDQQPQQLEQHVQPVIMPQQMPNLEVPHQNDEINKQEQIALLKSYEAKNVENTKKREKIARDNFIKELRNIGWSEEDIAKLCVNELAESDIETLRKGLTNGYSKCLIQDVVMAFRQNESMKNINKIINHYLGSDYKQGELQKILNEMKEPPQQQPLTNVMSVKDAFIEELHKRGWSEEDIAKLRVNELKEKDINALKTNLSTYSDVFWKHYNQDIVKDIKQGERNRMFELIRKFCSQQPTAPEQPQTEHQFREKLTFPENVKYRIKLCEGYYIDIEKQGIERSEKLYDMFVKKNYELTDKDSVLTFDLSKCDSLKDDIEKNPENLETWVKALVFFVQTDDLSARNNILKEIELKNLQPMIRIASVFEFGCGKWVKGEEYRNPMNELSTEQTRRLPKFKNDNNNNNNNNNNIQQCYDGSTWLDNDGNKWGLDANKNKIKLKKTE
jgi:hypothetical protein